MKESKIEQSQMNSSVELLPKSFRYIEDPGHAWLEVPYKFLLQLGIAAEISGCSYLKNDTAYLEEDCDAVTFIKAYLRAIGRPLDYAYFNSLICEVYQENTPIRSYEHYTHLEQRLS